MLEFKDWMNVDIRIGLIKTVEEIEGKDRLYKLEVSFGEETKDVVSGIKNDYSIEELEGKKVAFIYNLAPATIAGIESQAMILGAMDEDKKYKLLFIDNSVKRGTRVE